MTQARSAESGASVRVLPVIAFAALTGVAILVAIGEGSLPVVTAPLASSLVFAFGMVVGEPDIVYLAWLDQGSNLILLEAEASSASLLIVATSVITIMFLADFAYLTEASNRYGAVQTLRVFRFQLPRLALVGAVSLLLALAGLSLVPSIASVPSDQALLVAVLAASALALTAVLGGFDARGGGTGRNPTAP